MWFQTDFLFLLVFLIICCISNKIEAKNRRRHHHHPLEAPVTNNYNGGSVSSTTRQRHNHDQKTFNKHLRNKEQEIYYFNDFTEAEKELANKNRHITSDSKTTALLHRKHTGNNHTRKNMQNNPILDHINGEETRKEIYSKPHHQVKSLRSTPKQHHYQTKNSHRKIRKQHDNFFNDIDKDETLKKFFNQQNYKNKINEATTKPQHKHHSNRQYDYRSKDKAAKLYPQKHPHGNESFEFTTTRHENHPTKKRKRSSEQDDSISNHPKRRKTEKQSTNRHSREKEKVRRGIRRHYKHTKDKAKGENDSLYLDKPSVNYMKQAESAQEVGDKHHHKKKGVKPAVKQTASKRRITNEKDDFLKETKEKKTEKKVDKRQNRKSEIDYSTLKRHHNSYVANTYRKSRHQDDPFLNHLEQVIAINQLANDFMKGIKIDVRTKKVAFKQPRRKRKRGKLFETRNPPVTEIYGIGKELDRRLANAIQKSIKAPKRHCKNFENLMRGCKATKKGLERLLNKIEKL